MFQKNISKQYYLKKFFLYFQVSWLRGSDLQVLSSGWDKFTSDNRIRIFPADQSHSWTLSITNVTTKDTGAYLCQVNTEPKLTLRYILTVEGNFQILRRKKYTYAIICIMRLNCEDIKNICKFFLTLILTLFVLCPNSLLRILLGRKTTKQLKLNGAPIFLLNSMNYVLYQLGNLQNNNLLFHVFMRLNKNFFQHKL